MPRLKPSDPLLAVAKAIIIIAMSVLGLGIVALVAALPILLTQRAAITDSLASAGLATAPAVAMGAIALLIAGFLAVVIALFRFMQLLGKIIDTVGAGDPFIPENARRLLQMAWLSLTVQIVAVLIEIQGSLIGKMFPEGIAGEDWHFMVDGDFVFSGNGLLLAVVLFILARVFRKGTEMREELEGTV
jgi:hypothetical protein